MFNGGKVDQSNLTGVSNWAQNYGSITITQGKDQNQYEMLQNQHQPPQNQREPQQNDARREAEGINQGINWRRHGDYVFPYPYQIDHQIQPQQDSVADNIQHQQAGQPTQENLARNDVSASNLPAEESFNNIQDTKSYSFGRGMSDQRFLRATQDESYILDYILDEIRRIDKEQPLQDLVGEQELKNTANSKKWIDYLENNILRNFVRSIIKVKNDNICYVSPLNQESSELFKQVVKFKKMQKWGNKIPIKKYGKPSLRATKIIYKQQV